MPRSVQEILDPADELARRFEEYEPDPGDEEPVAEFLLRRAALERVRSERHIVEAWSQPRSESLGWLWTQPAPRRAAFLPTQRAA